MNDNRAHCPRCGVKVAWTVRDTLPTAKALHEPDGMTVLYLMAMRAGHLKTVHKCPDYEPVTDNPQYLDSECEDSQ